MTDAISSQFPFVKNSLASSLRTVLEHDSGSDIPTCHAQFLPTTLTAFFSSSSSTPDEAPKLILLYTSLHFANSPFHVLVLPFVVELRLVDNSPRSGVYFRYDLFLLKILHTVHTSCNPTKK